MTKKNNSSMCISPNFQHPSIAAYDGRWNALLQNISSHIARGHRDTGSIPAPPLVRTSFSAIRIPFSKRANEENGWKSRSKAAHKRTVSFNDKASVKFIHTLQEISQQEFAATWYSREEFDDITQACCKEIEKLDRGERLKDKKFCARGLESHTRLRSLAKKMNRSLAYQAVMDEQDRQGQEGILHEDALAHVYHAVSSSCQIWANTIALEDQRVAEHIHDDDSEQDPESRRLIVGALNLTPTSRRRTPKFRLTKS